MRGHYRITPLVGYPRVGAITKDGTDLPSESFGGASTYEDLFVAQWRYFGNKYGYDEVPFSPDIGSIPHKIPRTPVVFVAALADYWTTRLKRADGLITGASVSYFSSAKIPAAGLSTAHVWSLWDRARSALSDIAWKRPAMLALTYSNNAGFWRAMLQVAVQIDVVLGQKSVGGQMGESTVKAIEDLPETLGRGAAKVAEGAGKVAAKVAEGAGEVAAKVAEGAGRAAAGLGKGFFGELGAPLVLALGGLGLFVLSRRSSS